MGAGDRVAPDRGTGLFVFAFNTAPAFEADLDRWHGGDRMPRLAAVPGVTCARWFKTPADSPGNSTHKYVAICHVDSPSVCESSAWNKAWESGREHEMRVRMQDILLLVLQRYTRRA
jgi:hypothetical protein